MKINSIKIKNFRGLRDVDVSLEPNLTVFVGNNGAGKSSVLDAIGICLSWVIARIISAKGQGKLINTDELSNNSTSGMIDASFDAIPNLRIVNKAIKGIEKRVHSDLESLNTYSSAMRSLIEETNFKTNIPVVVHYGVSRVVVDIPLRIKNKHAFDLLETYNGSLSGSANFRDFFEWFRNQEDLENERFRQAGSVEKLSFQRELNAVRMALSRFMPEYTDLHVRRNPLRMIIRKNDQELRVDQLSDGEKCYMAMVGDLCRRLVLANPLLDNPLLGEGIVMIDELELHLHPVWQAEIATKLSETFPNIQFVVSTHSPSVLNRLPSRCIRILDSSSDGVRVLNSEIGYGLKSDLVLQQIMGQPHVRPVEIDNDFRALFEKIQSGDLEKAKALFSSLKERVPEEPELSRAEILICRKETLGV